MLFRSALHVLLAAGSSVLLMLALLCVILSLYRRDRARWRGGLLGWWLITGGCGLLFLIPRMVTTALEVFFTISAALLTRWLWLRRN